MGRFRRRLLRAAAACAAVCALALVAGGVAAYVVPLPERLAAGGSVVVDYRDGTPAHVFLAPDDRWRIPVPPEQVDAAYVDAIIALEDERFFWHPGVDPIAIVRAAVSNATEGRVVSGASTLTMQLVRVLEPRPRTLRSKVIEALRALQLEVHLDKQAILTAYLTFLPFGRNLEGVEVASLAYFGHTARDLSADEVATLLAVPQRPAVRHPSPRNAARLRKGRDEIASRLRPLDVLPKARLDALTAQPVPASLRPLPRDLPHAGPWLRAQRPAARRIRTTLDREAQGIARRVLADARADASARGIHNGAVVVVEHESASVRALVGNFDFWDDDHGGQIAGFDVPRSSGSTLKPVLYAMAIGDGLALPGFLVPDVPVTYGSYSPVNYDERFSGLVTLDEALSRSLNVPFVDLLADLDVGRFIGVLRSLGVASVHGDAGYYGLSSAVGGVELTPLELASLYAALARGGTARPLRALADEPERPATPVLDPAAVTLTRRALSRRDRPDFPDRRRWTRSVPAVFWKTGTSFGHRDAWSAGAGARHTAVVWLGNFDNTGSVHLVGADAAGPLLFDVLEGLGEGRSSSPEARDGLAQVEVCSFSGRLPGRACPHTHLVDALVDRVPTEPCPFHVEAEVAVASGRAVTPRCRAGRRTQTRAFLSLPTEVRRWMREGTRRLPDVPSFEPGCAVDARRGRPRIVTPAAGQVALLVPGVAAERQEIPLAARSPQGARLSWFVNGAFLGTVSADERLWWTPERGTHRVVVTDDAGMSDERLFEVRAMP